VHELPAAQPVTGRVVGTADGTGAGSDGEGVGFGVTELELVGCVLEELVADDEPDGEQVEVGDGELLWVADGEVLGLADGDVLAVGDGDVLAVGDGDVLAVGDGDVLAVGDGDVLAVADGELLWVADGEVLAVADGEHAARFAKLVPSPVGVLMPVGSGNGVPVGRNEKGNGELVPVADGDAVGEPACAGHVLASSRA